MGTTVHETFDTVPLVAGFYKNVIGVTCSHTVALVTIRGSSGIFLKTSQREWYNSNNLPVHGIISPGNQRGLHLGQPKHQIEASGPQVLARPACIYIPGTTKMLLVLPPGPAARHEHRARRWTRTTISSSSPAAP
jgi:hypothetical protein